MGPYKRTPRLRDELSRWVNPRTFSTSPPVNVWSTKHSTEGVERKKNDTYGSAGQVLLESLLPQPETNEGTECEEI